MNSATNHLIVTGSSGYLGKKVVAELKRQPTKFNIIEIDVNGNSGINLLDRDKLKNIRIQSDNCSLIHLAAQLPGTARAKSLRLNALRSIENIINILKPQRMLFLSSTAVYPIVQNADLILPLPWEVYGKSKLDSEEMIKSSLVDWTIVRSGTMFDKTRVGGIQKIFERAKNGKTIYLPKAGEVFHPFIATSDVVRSILLWAKDPLKLNNLTIDLVASEPVSFRTMLESFANMTLKINELPNSIKYFGSDSFPIFGISKWHLNALFYDIRSFPNKNIVFEPEKMINIVNL